MHSPLHSVTNNEQYKKHLCIHSENMGDSLLTTGKSLCTTANQHLVLSARRNGTQRVQKCALYVYHLIKGTIWAEAMSYSNLFHLGTPLV